MIPVGYLAKRVAPRPDWLKASSVTDIYSVSHCTSPDFANYIPLWRHNGWWFFDSPDLIQQLAQENSIDLHGTKLFYYEVHGMEYDEEEHEWLELETELPFETRVIPPTHKVLEGFDLVSFSAGTNAECSPLSCNHLAQKVETNSHCLFSTFEQAQQLVESEAFKGVEPGPYRIFAVYSVE